MLLESMSVLRNSLLVATISLAMPAVAADAPAASAVAVTAKTAFEAAVGQTVDKSLQIGTATARVKLVGGTAYIAVSKGSIDLTYADGTALTTINEGTVLKVEGFLMPGSKVVADVVGSKSTLSLAAAASLTLQSNAKGSELKLMQGGSPTTVALAAGATATISAPAVSFAAGQSVALKENQVGKANDVVAVGTATGLAVTTLNATATISGASGDQLILSKGAVLTISNGSLAVSATAVSVTGEKAQVTNASGNIQVVRNGKATAVPAGSPVTAAAADAAAAEEFTITEADKKILEELDKWNAEK